jgi:hypothetical protein
MALEGQDPAVIDDRKVEALPLPAHINTDPHSHESKLPHTNTPALRMDAEDVAGLGSHKHSRRPRAAQRQGIRPKSPLADYALTRLQAARQEKKRRNARSAA